VILNSSSRAILVNVPIFFMTAHQHFCSDLPNCVLTFANLGVSQGIDSDILVLLDSLEKRIVGWHFLIYQLKPPRPDVALTSAVGGAFPRKARWSL
jgi:hypothetical protein